MSLHKFAEQVASQGRGDDSLLVHMTPDEVRNLQRFAEANGTTLTINPTTGLPEAGLLSDLFKAVAPIALGAFLGPAGLGMSSMMAGLTTGGITTLATGSLSRGLMAGLGAYGGSGLGESLMTAGGGMSAANAATTAQQQLSGANLALGEAMPAQAAEQFTKDAVSRMTPSGAVSAGFNKAIASPTAALDFAKSNMGNLAYAAAPIMAGAMVPTTTKLGDPKDTGFIRQMAFNINPDTGRPDPLYGMREMTPVKTSEFGNKTFKGQRDLFYQQNQNPYELGVGSLNQPPQQQATPMAGGGIVALADGGIPGYAGNAGSVVSAPLDTKNEIYQYFAKPETQALLASGNDAAVAQALQDRNYSLADVAKATGTQNQLADYERRFAQAVNTPTTDATEFLAATTDVGLRDKNLATALQNSGLSAAGQYASTHGLADTGGITGTDFYNQLGYTAGALPGDKGGLEGLYANINYSAQGLQDQINAGKLTVAEAQRLADAEMARVGVSQKDIKAATGKDLFSLFTPKGVVLPTPFTSVTPGGYYGNNTGNPLTTTPGDITTNKDGTVTVQPNIPGRPTGGFTGMGQVKDAYTAGGGSLGYTSPVVKTPAEHEAAYNKLTDDSLDAYNFLMGKGKNLTQRTATTARPVMRRYDEAVLGRKIPKLGAKTTGTTTVKGTPGNPQSYFDEAAYLAANPSVAEELRTGKSVSGRPVLFTSGYDHYLKYGKAENRPFTGDYQGYLTALALADAANAGGGGGPGNDGGGGGGGTGGGSSGGNAAGAAAAAAGGNAAPGTGNAGDSAAAASAAAAAAGVGVGDSAASGGRRGGRVVGYASGGTARDGVQQINAGTDTVSQAINTATSALGGVSGGGGSFGFDGLFGSSGGSSSGGGISLLNGGFGGQNNTAGGGFGGRPPPTFSSTYTDTTRALGTDYGPIIDYSPFSEEGRRKMAEQVELGRAGGVTATGPMLGSDYGSSAYKKYQNIDSQIQQLPSVTAYNDYTKSIGGRQPTANEISQVEQLRKGIVGDPGFTNLVSQGGNMGVASPYNRTNMLGNGAPAGLDDSDMGRIGVLSAQRNAAERASYANRNPASMSDLAKQLGYASGGMTGYAMGGGLGSLGSYSDGGRLLKGPGDGVSDSIPATIGRNRQPARLADGEFVIPARIVSELGNGSTDAGAKKLYAMMDRVQRARGKTTGKNKVAANSRSDKYLPA